MRTLLPVVLLAACSAPQSVETLENPLVYPSSRTTVRRQADRVRADGSLEIELLVKGEPPNDWVGVRASVDGAAWQDFAAARTGQAVEGRNQWLAVIPAGWKRAEYAAYAYGASGWAWDNNGESNFIAEADAVVHRVGDTRDGNTLHIDLDVRNLTYDKVCSAVLTDNGWLTPSYAMGSWVGPTQRAGVERWRIDVALSNDPYPAYLHAGAAVVEYAVSCSQADQGWWDNNHERNYRSERVPQPDRIFATPFDGGADVAVADDGTSYVLSGGRWLSAFAADGRWLFARELPENTETIRWLDGTGILLAQYSSSSPRFAGLSREGRELWTLTGLTNLVETPTAEYLIGTDGGARLTQTAPVVRAPTGGCSAASDSSGILSFPVVSSSGVLYCTLPAGGIGRIYLDGAPREETLVIDGTPWAADGTGNLVVLSPDRSTLIGYGPGSVGVVETWRKTGLTVPPDTQYGQGATCPNHAVSDVGLYYNRPGSGTDHYLAGFDLQSGSERFRIDSPVYGGPPCAAADGTFYMNPGYERYGKSVIRITTDGRLDRPDLGLYGAVLAIRRDGRLLRREWAYYPNTSGRIVLTDADGQELYSQTFSGGSSTDYRAAVNGTQLSVLPPGQLLHFLFTP